MNSLYLTLEAHLPVIWSICSAMRCEERSQEHRVSDMLMKSTSPPNAPPHILARLFRFSSHSREATLHAFVIRLETRQNYIFTQTILSHTFPNLLTKHTTHKPLRRENIAAFIFNCKITKFCYCLQLLLAA